MEWEISSENIAESEATRSAKCRTLCSNLDISEFRKSQLNLRTQ